ncbi:winged helix-turn-helix transcriptional regulator [Mucilaginibacter aquariorum]|uniref:Helix-turn-helix transcriptional regulator n=1 Tax=Mucilaginibacter aquariorum TaxID=2967225 RepID=A0ABT1T817_9SPHI|nr:helix-turn-helix domain-containing protein [Mucilaginibacter aquariorum]MCQ6960759.1 helix-turn-helix transcriptional regulator [Mucilaginibacter aquariorum]
MKVKKTLDEECLTGKNGIRDAQGLLAGKWKFSIIAALHFEGVMRFMDLLRHIDGIAPKVLSNELKDLELNHLVTKTVCDTRPVTVEYELTQLGHDLEPVILEMSKWGVMYRNTIVKN